MELGPLLPDDANEMLRIARENGQKSWFYTPGAHGTVVRDGNTLRGFCLLRETALGFIVDELWCDKSREGVASIGLLAKWIEATMRRIVSERAATITLGGIVRTDNPKHKAALVRRGYKVVAEVLTKEFSFEGKHGSSEQPFQFSE